jgi:hypothetical protein
MKMSKRITKFILMTLEGPFRLQLYKGTKFLCNDGNVLYFEYPLEDNVIPEMEERDFYIVKYDIDFMYIKDNWEYVCSYTDNAHIKYFIYEEK